MESAVSLACAAATCPVAPKEAASSNISRQLWVYLPCAATVGSSADHACVTLAAA